MPQSALFLALIFVAAASIPTSAYAQDADRTLPRQPKPQPAPTTLPDTPSQSNVLPDDPAPIVPTLRRLLIERPNEPSQDPSTKTEPPAADPQNPIDVRVDFLQDDSKLNASLAARIGKPLSLADLNAICAEIVNACRAAGRPVVDVTLPEQDITEGNIRIVLIEGQLGRVRTEGEPSERSRQRTERTIRIQPGEPILATTLLEDIDWLNRTKLLSSYRPIFEKGDLPGQADIVLERVGPRYPLRAYGAFENTGNTATGENRLVSGFNWGDALFLGLDHQLSYQFSTDSEVRRFHAHGLSYTAPLPWRHIASLSGTWSRSEPDLSDPAFDSVGESWQISGRYEIPLRKRTLGKSDLRQSIALGADFKESNNNLEFGDEQVFDRAAQTVQFILEYRFALVPDPTGPRRWNTNGSARLVLSPGYLASNNNSSAYEEARAGADPRYAYLNLDLQHQLALPGDALLSVRTAAQAGTGALLSGEQFSIGGADTVRGLDEQSLNSDTGLLGSIELQSPSISLLSPILRKPIDDDLRLFVFADAAVGWNYNSSDEVPSSVYAFSVGPGIRYRIKDHASLEAAYGVRLSEHGLNDPDANEDGRFHFRLSASFAW